MARLAVFVSAIGILGTVGCAATMSHATPGQEPGPPPATPTPTLDSVTAAVLADAAKRTGIDKSALVVQSAEAVTWADGSLGCPAPDMSYTMAEVPGYRVRIVAGGQELDYHSNRRGDFLLCPAGRAIDPTGPVAY